MRWLICFDISDDRKRARAVRTLLDHGVRVQKSVFEAPDLDRPAFLRLRSLLEGIVDPATDSLRYYPLCKACLERVETFGVGPAPLGPVQRTLIL